MSSHKCVQHVRVLTLNLHYGRPGKTDSAGTRRCIACVPPQTLDCMNLITIRCLIYVWEGTHVRVHVRVRKLLQCGC